MTQLRFIGLGAVLIGTLFVTGCVTRPKPLYHWGEYQPQVYEYFKGDGSSHEEQIAKLEETIQKARATDAALPPWLPCAPWPAVSESGQGRSGETAIRNRENPVSGIRVVYGFPAQQVQEVRNSNEFLPPERARRRADADNAGDRLRHSPSLMITRRSSRAIPSRC
jgi:hypothetical protein